MAERLGQQKVRVKSLDEIMAEKRQRASQESVEAPKDKEVAKEEERGLKNSPQRNQQRKPLNRVSGELRKKLQIACEVRHLLCGQRLFDGSFY